MPTAPAASCSFGSTGLFSFGRSRLESRWDSINLDTSPGFRAIQGYADAVDESGDGDAKAAADEKTVATVNHPNCVGNLERLQTELPKTVLALLPLKTSDTLKKKKQKLKEKNQGQDQDLKRDKKK